MNKVIDRRRSLDAQPDARRTTLFDYVTDLAGKTPTPGGGGAAAIAAGLGCAAGAMACAYSQRKKDQASGAAVVAAQTGATLSNAAARELDAADADAKAYLALQATWKKDFHGNKSEAQAKALAVPQSLVERCARHVAALDVFYPKCNPNILSDAKVGIHLLAGAARAAFATVLVNDPPANVRRDLETKLRAIAAVEARIWGERNSGAAAGAPARGFEVILDARGICAVAAAVAGAFLLGKRMRS
jgi:formiminotetrahydrofolate cyclodeaminase